MPIDRSLWSTGSRRLQTTRPGTDGRFAFTDLPPGEYRLVALTDFDEDTWHTPAFLESILPSGVAVSLGEGERKVQDLQTRR
jgi:hypothetical protein